MTILRPAGTFLVLVAFYIARLAINAILPLAPDEAYYWYWSLHPDWSYMDHPPMVAYVMALSTAVGGNTGFFVRAGGLLLTVLSLAILFLAVRTLFPKTKETAWDVLLFLNVTLLFPAGCIVQTPDTPMLFFWVLAVYCGSRIVAGGGGAWWYAWGVSLGLGLLSKYTMILLVPCTALFFLLSRDDRAWFFRKEPYLALAAALLIFSPVVLWNWRHDWVSFAFQLHHGFSPITEKALAKLLSYVGGQAGVVTPLLFAAFVVGSVEAFRVVRREGNRPYLYLLALSWPVFLFFAVSTAKGHVAAPNWVAPAYIAGIPLTLEVYRTRLGGSAGHRRFLFAAFALALSANVLLHVHLLRPILPVPPEKDVTHRFHDWPGLGRAVADAVGNRPSRHGYFLVSDKGTTVAEAVFYSGAIYTGVDLFRPERYLFLENGGRLRGRDAIILSHRSREAALLAYAPHFEEVEVLGRRPYVFRGEELRRLSVNILLGKGYRGDFPAFGGRAGKKAPGPGT